MLFIPAPEQYSKAEEDRYRRAAETNDNKNVKTLNLQSPDGKWWRPTISNAGVVTWTAL